VSATPSSPVAVVTGATNGIGRAIVDVLVADGYRIAAISRSAQGRAGWKSPNSSITAYNCDVGERSEALETIDRVTADHGRIDALINCAGNIIGQSLEGTTDSAVDAQFRVNFLGTLYFCQACLPHLRLSRGAIVNFSSLITTRPVPGAAIYAATKGAVAAFSKVIANELAPAGIRVYVLSPSLVRSNIYMAGGMPDAEYADLLEDWKARFPLGRVGEPMDVAPLVGFLLSRGAQWMTGNEIVIDGGRTIALQ